MSKKKLSMQLVPSQAHGRNLRSVLKSDSWRTLSRAIRNRDRVCVHCSNKSEHTHEVWEWVVSEGKLIQRLIGLDGVCKDCHDFMHYGRVMACESDYRQGVVLDHAIRVLSCDPEWFGEYFIGCFHAHRVLSQLSVTEFMDLGWIYDNVSGKLPDLGVDQKDWTNIWDEINHYVGGVL
jgi:hypothetical protein